MLFSRVLWVGEDLIDVCVVTYNSEDTIGGTLASVERHIPDVRVSIWDNSPGLRTVEAVEHYQERSSLDVKMYHDGGNIGFGYGCNRLAALSTEKWLIFLNPDAEVLGWPARGVDLDSDHLVGAAVYLPDGVSQETFGWDRTIWSEFKDRVVRRHSRQRMGESLFATDFVSGAAFLVDRARFLERDGFDAERYFMYYEDLDLGRRWRHAGGTVEVDPSWRVAHVGGHSARQDHVLALTRSFESARAYHRRWSRNAWLFRPICIAEGVLKLTLALPRGRVGGTSLGTQWQYCVYLISGGLLQTLDGGKSRATK